MQEQLSQMKIILQTKVVIDQKWIDGLSYQLMKI